VTGGSRGIGLAIAEALVACGARVAITGMDERRLEVARARLARSGTGVDAIRADVRDAGEVQRMVDRAAGLFGRLDILVNNAGIGSFAPVADQAIEEWRRTIDTNLTGVFYCCHAAIPHLRRAGGGWIINISSLAGKNSFRGGAAYCASKAGLNAFSEALMQEVRYDDIRVSYVMPGSVATDFANDSEKGSDWKLAPADVAQVVLGLLFHDPRSLPSRVELRPSKPRKA
jgi:NAD(P)-dependent dehydrogenase (short-subunit alcohol dehydrogenase family)